MRDPCWVVDRTKDGKIISQVIQVVNNVQTLFKNVVHAQVLLGYNINVHDDGLLLDPAHI
ncbi:hypothetical protein M404DRAFT_30691 [Pisolithus tinctorius Marx 270]|uniref:Uncharacterized protein n=1 Tax=Pisolithus tinctorius Marx 270 TaxID=870435 RepID=A0A0C3NDU9_PISTI|nr:hypothetical protein M404DRAFT_30691 [Pisolithus tinctorius Marx 270]